ncbi:MAG: non-canonical purine NTP diphosphatase [Bacteroidales bacterium]|nr:non-canonical purine NTP diphosphatase [Bacteroidales bacterium]
MLNLIFASHNPHKLEEVRAILGAGIQLGSLGDIGCYDDIPEPYESLEENALAKAAFVAERYGVHCFADDTGLEAEALDGLPGVHSARYAGAEKDNLANIRKLLQELSHRSNRKARFRTVIALVLDGQSYLFEGVVNGHITHEPRGLQGFGYDPVFVPDGFEQTFAEMDATQKNSISHRYQATRALSDFLKKCKQ